MMDIGHFVLNQALNMSDSDPLEVFWYLDDPLHNVSLMQNATYKIQDVFIHDVCFLSFYA